MADPREQTRQHTRAPVARRVALELSDRGRFVHAYTTNFSRGGIFLRTNQPPASGTRVSLVVTPPGGGEIALQGEVVQVVGAEEAKEKGVPAGVGVRFDAIAAEAQARLDAVYQDCVREAGAVHAAGPSREWVAAEPPASAPPPKPPVIPAPPPIATPPVMVATPAPAPVTAAESAAEPVSAPAAPARPCPNCGEPAEPGRRSCIACGAAFDGAAPPGPPAPASHLPPTIHERLDSAKRAEPLPPRRSYAAVLCAELSGLTELSAGSDPAAVHEMLDRCFEGLIDAVHRQGGSVDNLLGDALVAVFGVPETHEDDALRAVRASLEMQSFLRDEMPALKDQLSLRIGLSAGQVFAGHVGAPGRHVYTVLGEPVKLAQALEQAASAGEVLATDAIRRDCSEAVEMKAAALPPARRKELASTYQVVGLVRIDPATRELPLVGREVPLTQVQYLSEALEAGEPCAVVVTGEPGVGKTRYAVEVARQARGRGWTALVGRPPGYRGSAALGAFRPVLLQAAGLDEGAELAQLTQMEQAFLKLGLAKDDVDALLALVFPERGGPKRAVAGAAVAQILERLARAHPVLLAIDDVQWASPAAMDLLEALTGKDAPPGLLVMAVGRPEAAGALPNARGRLEIPLEKLGQAEIAQLAASALDVPELPPELGAYLAGRSDGNPRAVREQVRALQDAGALSVAEGRARFAPPLGADPGAPDSPFLLRVRLSELRAEVLRTLRMAAVAGERFELGVVQRAVGDEDAPFHLEELRLRGFLKPIDEKGAFAFTFPSAHAVAGASIAKEELAPLHEKVWKALEAAGAAAGIAPADLQRRMAEHAREAGQVDAAVGLLQRAAELQLDAGEPSQAVKELGRALDWLPADARPTRRLDLVLRQAECALRAGDLGTAERQLPEALALARGVGDRAAEAAAARGQARLLRLRGRHEEAQAASEEAVTAAIKAGDEAAWMLARIELADVYDARGDQAKALTEYRAALVQADEHVHQAAKAAGERSVRARLCNRIATLQAKGGDVSSAEETLQKALEESRRDKDPQEEGRALASLGALCARRGDRARAKLYADQAIECARAAGDRMTEARQTYNLGQLAYADGQAAEAREQFLAARALAEEIHWQEGVAMVARALDKLEAKGRA